jgi:hypothetical protein
MTRADALATLGRLAHGLDADHAGCSRLLERIAGQGDEAELLRDLLVEQGARALLDREPQS